MPALTECRPSAETKKIAAIISGERYPYPDREAISLRPYDAIYSDKDLAAYMKAMRLNKLSLDLQAKVKRMKFLSPNWDTYGANPPNDVTRNLALDLVTLMEAQEFLPADAVASAEGGVALSFTAAGRYADIELLNSGDILAVTVTGQQEPIVWEVERSSEGILRAIERIYAHISA